MKFLKRLFKRDLVDRTKEVKAFNKDMRNCRSWCSPMSYSHMRQIVTAERANNTWEAHKDPLPPMSEGRREKKMEDARLLAVDIRSRL